MVKSINKILIIEGNMNYTLGLDIGIASLGFSVLDNSGGNIISAGVRIFEAAENPKDGSSLAAPRREKRGLRRVIHRRAKRKQDIRKLLAKYDLPFEPWVNVYQLRADALTRKLDDVEFASVLFHIAKKRGFQSNRKGATPNDTEGKKALSGAKELEVKMLDANKETIGAYLSTLTKQRNGNGDYDRFVTRDLLRDELKKIFDKQQKFGNQKATNKLLQEYSDIAFFQRPLQSSEHLVGICTFEEGEKRSPKFSYSAELFVMWSKVNNTIIRNQKGEDRQLTLDEKRRIVDKTHNLKKFTYAQARKELDLADDDRFNIGYRKIKDSDNSWDAIRKTAETADFLKLIGYHTLKDILGSASPMEWQKWLDNRSKLDEIARVVSFYEDQTQIEDLLTDAGVEPRYIPALLSITSFSKTVDLSLKAINKIMPHLQAGLTYDKACAAAGYDHNKKQTQALAKIPPFADVKNPVVNRALSQTRKVINAVIGKYGMPETIIVELARDVGKSFKDRKDIEREQKKNQANREEAKNHAAEIMGTLPDNIRGEELLKYRLLKEQQHLCPYSGVYITPEMLRDSTATQIDHIIPYSRSWDDSYMNKVLCITSANQEKGNKIPFEYIGNTKSWNGLEVVAKTLPTPKANRLLMAEYSDEKANEWKSRALNDTRYMARLLKNHLEQSLDLGKGNRVQTRNGALTAHLRRSWGFPEKSRANDRHHALDAIVLASSTQSMVQNFANWNKQEEKRKRPTERVLPPLPWETFREDAKAAVENIFVSRMPVRKITGAAHQETIRSIRMDENGERQIVQRIKLASLSPASLENMVDKDRNIRLYNLLKERLEAHGGKADKAFAEPIYMPVNDPSKIAPRVNSINIMTNDKSGIEINEGLASNGDMVRVDVFKKNGKFFLVPIYVHQFTWKKLPNKAILAAKPETEWEEMVDEDFIFSLYKNDLVRIKSKKEEILAYYAGTHRGTGCINLRTHDSDPSFGKDGVKEGLGVKTLLIFEKYNVDYFGNKTLVGKEVRCGVANSDDSEDSEDFAIS
jgi:CRISPR-associated endonuclease Csn1